VKIEKTKEKPPGRSEYSDVYRQADELKAGECLKISEIEGEVESAYNALKVHSCRYETSWSVKKRGTVLWIVADKERA
jgi:hypothetical protein